ncbi:alkaline phosphatase PhoX [Sphingomonas mesophila]|uniref:alkaline phosphatase PhoX n=1 Tax=Sphingomonas mesophila TaxID=2303576 RepID=UPI001F0768CE|nr:alkaline phosphatase PhoX [Sphingomonas mesophila]
MSLSLTRRDASRSLVAAALAGLAAAACSHRPLPVGGTLRPDPAGLLDLPDGFSYSIISSLGEPMDDGEPVPDRADGMGAFAGPGRTVILVRNHELKAADSTIRSGGFDRYARGGALPGGTTTLVYDPVSGRIVSQYRSLAGTIRNCSGGVTPWRSWLTCEEDVTRAGGPIGRDHGWVFEVPADLKGLAEPVPLTGLGRFNHEAAVVDPATGIVYLTEDRDDSLFYRFLPSRPGRLREPGRLQALVLRDGPSETRNRGRQEMRQRTPFRASWIDLDGIDSPDDDLRLRGAARGACRFARGEGIIMGRGEMYFTCTSGGAAKLGQVMRYRPSRFEGTLREAEQPGLLDLFFESERQSQFYYGDNLDMAPNGDLIVCEDQPGAHVDNHLRGIRPDGSAYAFARLRMATELAGICFAPDGRTMFVNAYRPTRTFAISGPFARLGRLT